MPQSMVAGKLHGEITTPEAARPPMRYVRFASHDLHLGESAERADFGGAEIAAVNRLDHVGVGLGQVHAGSEDHQRAARGFLAARAHELKPFRQDNICKAIAKIRILPKPGLSAEIQCA